MRLRHPLLLALLILAIPLSGIASDPADIKATLSAEDFEVRDRLEILNLLQAYSHAADGLHTELFGEAFTEDAVFSIAPYIGGAEAPLQTMGRGRTAIVAALSDRHDAFRKAGTQRRHFLTNPIVWKQTETTAEVSVYLQLRASTQGSASKLVATGRYQGRVRKTAAGWRISEWTFFSDQALE